MTLDSATYAPRPPLFIPPAEEAYTLREILDLLDEAKWAEYARRWTAYARSRQCRHGQRAARFLSQPGDYVQEAIRLTLEGRRHFENGTVDEFFAFICSVIDSLISHEASREKRHFCVALVSDTDEPAMGEVYESNLAATGSSEEKLLFLNDLEKFLTILESDLATYARLRAVDAYSTAEEYAIALNTSVSEIRNMDRRLRRRRNQWMGRHV